MRQQGSGPLGARLGELSQRFGHAAEAEPAPLSVRGARLCRHRRQAQRAPRTNDRGPSGARRLLKRRRRFPRRRQAPEPHERDIDEVIAEIAARQRALDARPSRPAPAPAAAPAAPIATSAAAPMAAPTSRGSSSSFSTSPIRSSRCASLPASKTRSPPCAATSPTSRAPCRRPAAPHAGKPAGRRAPARRADQSRLWPRRRPSQLETIERSLAEVHERLNAMTPAESLAGFDARISELSHKMDSVSAGSPDPETLRYLEAAITELRELSAGVASAEGVASLAGDVQALCARIDHIAERTGAAGLDSLAHRVNELTQALDTRVEQVGPLPQNIESLVQALSDKLNHSDSASRDQAAFEHIERQILHIADKLDAADHKTGDLARDRARHPAAHLAGARGARGGDRHRRARGAQGRGRHGGRGARRGRGCQRAQARSRIAPRHACRERAAHPRDARSRARHARAAGGAARDDRNRRPFCAAGLRAAGLCAAAAAEPQAPMQVPQVYAPPMQPRRTAPMPEARALEPIAPREPAPAVPARATPFVHVQRTERPPIDPDLPADTPLEPGSAGRRARPPSASPRRKPRSPRSSASRRRRSPARRISSPPRGAPRRPPRVKAARSKVRAAKNARATRRRPA